MSKAELQNIIGIQAERIAALERALRLAHEWLDPTEMPEADYCIIRAALAQEQDK